MKFSENLQKLRKEKGLSQEALAEQLDVTRQSVSKWESGASYPEMDKLIALCKLFDCDLDSLVNGSINKNKEVEEREVIGKEIFKKLDTFMKKMVFFFENMTAKEIFKFLFEIFILVGLIFLFRIPFEILKSAITQLLREYSGFHFFLEILHFGIDFVYILFALLIFFYVLKIKYLDQVENTEIKNKILEITENKKTNLDSFKEGKEVKIEKIYIQKTGKSLSDVFVTFLLWLCKFWVFLFLIGFLFCLFAGIVLFGITIGLTIEGLPLFGIVFLIFGGILFLFSLIDPCIHFLFNQKKSIKRILITMILAFIFFAIGTTITFINMMHITYYNEISPYFVKENVVEEFPMQNTLNTCGLPTHLISYQEDETLQDQIRIKVRTFFNKVEIRKDETDRLYINYLGYQAIRPQQVLKEIKKDLQQGKLYNYYFEDPLEITIEGSSKNLYQLQRNGDQCS